MTSTPIVEMNLSDVSTHQANTLLKLQRDILEEVALGTEQNYISVLDQLYKMTEVLIPDAVASIMVFDESHSFLQVLSAPSLPADAINALNGLVPGERAGSCGTAIYSNQPQYVFDTQSDFRWSDFKQFIVDFSVGACWSMPIRIKENNAIGSFALSSFEERKPSSFHIHLLETSASIASVIIKRQQEQDHLWKMAHHDTLTGLPNRTLLALRLQRSLENKQRKQNKVGVLFLDLDNFKDINDTQGHDVGDDVLKLVAKQVNNNLRPEDTFARLGGDEFVIIVDSFKDTDALIIICKKIINAVKNCNNSMNFAISTSIGVSIYPDDGDNINILLRNADTAMYEAKSRGASNFHFYQDKLTLAAQDRLQLTREISIALIEEQFVVHYQPQYDNKANKILGIEALVRWKHDVKGLIPPADFIPVAEKNGHISDIGFFVIKHACEQCLEWWKNGLPKFTLAVNVSVKQLQPGFVEKLQSLLQSINFPVSLLELEITESSIMQNEDLTELIKLNTLGLNIAMDDFGTGHSSLAQLKCLPINKLKIDRSFIKDIPQNKDDVTMAKTIIAMGHGLDLNIVAEGVETEEQRLFLEQQNCDLLQGYLFSKPVSADKLNALLTQQTESL